MNSGTEPSVIGVDADDAEMLSAMQNAREQFPHFWNEISADYQRVIPAFSVSMAKVYFADPEAALSGEHLWVSDIRFDGSRISGTVAQAPGHLKTVELGSSVCFTLDRLSDWFYADNGKVVGAFTVQLLRSRMTPEEREAHDQHYPYRFE